MRYNGFKAFYYEALPIASLSVFDVPEKDGVKTGGMSAKKFLSLVDSIESKGLINPITIEDGRRLTVQIGNNRVWAVKQLGHTHIKSILFSKELDKPEGGIEIPLKFLEHQMKILHPGDNTWMLCQAARYLRRAVKQEIG